jgi:hypothetical protein
MQKLITNKELDSILQATINADNQYYANSKNYFNDLYNTGCRTKEPLDITRWSYNNNKVYLNTFKTEAIRIFDAKILSSDLLFERNLKGETPLSIASNLKNTKMTKLLEDLQISFDRTRQKAGDLLA